MPRSAPSRAFRVRDRHRSWLTIHFVALAVILVAAFIANRSLTPETFWVQWVALGGGLLFAAHLAVFARSTLATMGGKDHR